MIKKVYNKLKADGIGGLLEGIYRLALPHRLEYYPHCKSFFQSGTGMEIGGPSSIFGRRGYIPVYSVAVRIDNCNFSNNTVWEGTVCEGDTFIFNQGKATGRQYIAEASNLQCMEDSSYDFILSSHCIEHLANPLQGLAEWIRVLKQNGLLVLVVPHKDGTFDHRRPLTALEHLIQDFESQTSENDMTHLEEILKFHDLTKDPGAGDFQSFQERSKRNNENRCLHHHVFDTRLAVEAVNYMGLQILAVELFRPFHIVLIAKKIGPDQTLNNEKFRGINAAPCWLSPFSSDRKNAGPDLKKSYAPATANSSMTNGRTQSAITKYLYSFRTISGITFNKFNGISLPC
ncbi:MAG: methyltransferase domain-containing protein [Deltaproteobacteria bacterium]|nr:methyltransferase domain-containing protein [Deltaproteobacteria bacterium]